MTTSPARNFRCWPEYTTRFGTNQPGSLVRRRKLRSLIYCDRLAPSGEVFMGRHSSDLVARASTLSILWGVSLICLGMFAVALPQAGPLRR